jgi:WD40 repeat protein
MRGEGTGDGRGRRFLIATAIAHYSYAPQWDRPGLLDARKEIIDLFTGLLGYQHVSDLGLNPTKDQLTAQLRAFCRSTQRRPDDMIAVYIAGHGEVLDDSQDHVLLTTDTDPHDIADALPTAELARKMLLNTPVRRVLLMLDACYSGRGGNELAAAALTRMTQHWGDNQGSGLVVITSAQPAEQAQTGTFPLLLRDAVEGLPIAGYTPSVLALDAVVKAMNDSPSKPGFQTISSTLAQLTGEVPPFLPNPRHDPRMTEVDLAIQQASEWEAQAERRDIEYRTRLLVRAMGGHDAAQGWWFSGRHAALIDITSWLTHPDPARPLLAVTAAPGSGKTAVLGLIATLTNPERRVTVPLHGLGLPSAAIPAPDTIDVVIYAQNLTTDQVLQGITAAAHLHAAKVGELLDQLTGRAAPLTVLVDALDEAADPDQLTRHLLRPLAEHANGRLRLLVGTRPHLLANLGLRREDSIDLDGPRYADLDALTTYAARGLLDAVPDSPYQRQQPSAIRAIARAVAEASDPSFLVARITSSTLAADPAIPNPLDPAWRQTLPRLPGDAMRRDLEIRLGGQAEKVRDLLRPLAFAEGQGLPWEDIWAPLASRIAAVNYTDDDLLWLRHHAGSYVVEATETNRSAYRLYHQALAEHLRDDTDDTAIHRAFTHVLRSRVPLNPDGSRDWTRAHPYALRYLATHAAHCGLLDEPAGGVFDNLVCDLSFVAVAEPSRLLQALPAVTTAEGRRVAETLTRIGRQLLLFPARERLSYLELAARKSGDSQLADRVSDVDPDRPWAVPWARWAAPASGRTIGHHGPYIVGLSLMSLGGRPVVAAADRTAVRLWDPQTARAVGELAEPGLADIVAMTTTTTDTGPRVVTGHADGTITFWNPVTGSCVAREATQSGGVTATVLAHDLVVSDGMGANLTLWRVSDATPIASIAIPPGAQLRTAGRVDDLDLAILYEENRTVQLWNLTNQEAVGEPLVLHEKASLWACAFGVVDGVPVVFTGINGWGDGSSDAGSSVRDVVSWPAMKQVLPDAGWGPESAALTSTAEQTALSIGGADGVLRRFTWADDRFVPASKMTAHDSDITTVAFWNHNGRTVEITGGRDGAVRTWQAGSSDSLTEAGPDLWRRSHVLSNTDTGVLLLGPDRDRRLSKWDVATGDNLGALTGLSERAASSTMTACRIGDRPVVVAGYHDGWLAILDVNTGEVIDELVVSDSAVVALRVAPSPGTPVVVCVSADGAISCYDLDQSTWMTRGTRLYDSGGVELDTIHLDGRRIAVTLGYDIEDSHASLRLWDIDAGAIVNQTLATLDSADVFGPTEDSIWLLAAGHVDGRAIAVWMGGGSAVRVWDLRSGELIKTGFVEDGHGMATHHVSIDRLHGQDVIISGGHAGALSIWDLSGTIRTTIEVGYSTSAWHVMPPDSLIVGGTRGVLKLRLTSGFLVN